MAGRLRTVRRVPSAGHCGRVGRRTSSGPRAGERQGCRDGVPVTSDEGRYVVGSAEDCDIRISDDPYVSSHHCALTVGGAKVSVEDLGSTNGTWINEHVRV